MKVTIQKKFLKKKKNMIVIFILVLKLKKESLLLQVVVSLKYGIFNIVYIKFSFKILIYINEEEYFQIILFQIIPNLLKNNFILIYYI